MSTVDRNTLLKISSTGEYIVIHPEFNIRHLTMLRSEATPFTEEEALHHEAEYTTRGLQLEREDWLIQLWKRER